MGIIRHTTGVAMKNLYQITRHLVWLTQFGLPGVAARVVFAGAVWLKNEFALGG